MTGLLTRPIVAFVKATSSAGEVRPYCAAMHSWPSACRGTINLLKHDPSAQSPWQNTILGFVCVDFDVIFVLLFSLAQKLSIKPNVASTLQLGKAAHRNTVTTRPGAYRAPRVTESRSRLRVGVRDPTELGF